MSRASGSTIEMSTPPTLMEPSVTSHNRAARRAQVLLPEPEGPTKAVTSPSRAVKFTPSNTFFLS